MYTPPRVSPAPPWSGCVRRSAEGGNSRRSTRPPPRQSSTRPQRTPAYRNPAARISGGPTTALPSAPEDQVGPPAFRRRVTLQVSPLGSVGVVPTPSFADDRVPTRDVTQGPVPLRPVPPFPDGTPRDPWWGPDLSSTPYPTPPSPLHLEGVPVSLTPLAGLGGVGGTLGETRAHRYPRRTGTYKHAGTCFICRRVLCAYTHRRHVYVHACVSGARACVREGGESCGSASPATIGTTCLLLHLPPKSPVRKGSSVSITSCFPRGRVLGTSSRDDGGRGPQRHVCTPTPRTHKSCRRTQRFAHCTDTHVVRTATSCAHNLFRL